ncbi:alkyl sulfatase C-terminal domain-containing protein [Uniformispora flossi]|uniref:alkyl sulfatase C-terminal domain-containing protein n=1 Tax=Uniformispora flossi TaxID=3390723 RepID=UPI003C2B3EF2
MRVAHWTFTGAGDDQPWTMWVRGGVLNARPGHADGAQLTLTGPKPVLAGVLLNPAQAARTLDAGHVKAEGDVDVLARLAEATDAFDPHFTMITP